MILTSQISHSSPPFLSFFSTLLKMVELAPHPKSISQCLTGLCTFQKESKNSSIPQPRKYGSFSFQPCFNQYYSSKMIKIQQNTRKVIVIYLSAERRRLLRVVGSALSTGKDQSFNNKFMFFIFIQHMVKFEQVQQENILARMIFQMGSFPQIKYIFEKEQMGNFLTCFILYNLILWDLMGWYIKFFYYSFQMSFLERQEPANLLPDVKKKYNHFVQSNYSLRLSGKKPNRFNTFNCDKNFQGNTMPSIGSRSKCKSKDNNMMNEKNNYFSYQKVVRDYIIKLVGSEKGWVLKKDIQPLVEIIGGENDIIFLKEKLQAFKKQSKNYFNFEMIESRILFHLILAELQIHNKNICKSIEEFQLCEYQLRKENLDSLTLCFLWELANLYLYEFQFEKAAESMQNLLQMSIVLGMNNKLNKYIFQKMSLIYYYRGNSILSLHYLQKAEKGLTLFEKQIYNRQYSKRQEINRLEVKLFPSQPSVPSLKRKNNPRFIQDINRNSFQEYHELKTAVYADTINCMMKNHDSSKGGRFIKEIVRKNKNIGNIQSYNETTYPRYKYSECTVDNSTRILKTHLSKNRQTIKINREQRWKKFINFIKEIFSIINQERYSKSRRMARMIR